MLACACISSGAGPIAVQGATKGDQARGPAVLTGATLKLDVRPMAAAATQPLTAGNQKLELLAALLRVRSAALDRTVPPAAGERCSSVQAMRRGLL